MDCMLKIPGKGVVLVAEVLDWVPEGWWFKPRRSHNTVSAAVGPLSKVLNPTLLQGAFSRA